MQIEHDPNETPEFQNRVARWTIIAYIFVFGTLAFALKTYFGLEKNQTFDLLNIPFFVAFLALLSWCLIPRALKSEAEQPPSDKVAFRLGKFLNRVLRRWR